MLEDYIFTYKKWFYAIPEMYNIKIADPSDLVNCHTSHRFCNSSAVDNCYWALLKLYVGSTVCKYSHQNNKTENIDLSSETLHQSLCPSVMFDHCSLQILKVSSQITQTIPLTIWVNIFIQKHIHKQNTQKLSLWMVIFDMLE